MNGFVGMQNPKTDIYCESQTLPNTCKIKLNKFSK